MATEKTPASSRARGPSDLPVAHHLSVTSLMARAEKFLFPIRREFAKLLPHFLSFPDDGNGRDSHFRFALPIRTWVNWEFYGRAQFTPNCVSMP
jgi:hypothetical protein